MNRVYLVLIPLFLLTLAGCLPSQNDAPPTSVEPTESNVSAEPGTSSDEEATEETSGAPESGDGVELNLASLEELQAEIAKTSVPVVVDFWSTSCLPCMKEFPGLVALHNEHGEKLRCISMCLDYIGIKSKPPETYREDVVAFLQSTDSTLTNYLSTTPDEEIYSQLSIDSIPAVFVYGADGKLTKQFLDGNGEFSYEKDINPFISEMLNE